VPSPTPPGVEVVSVPRGSSAAVAGLKPGDVIEAVNGLTVRSMQDLGADLYVLPPNSAVRLTVDSDSTVHTVKTMLQPAA
jgi:serine protease Do